ncbi:mannitol dehydrogenase family protein [Zobellia sp. 1_MG-2023]|uniref:mannitol dehydrogenase family protein n=1 Tax=Zobellia sp. 1_MG-2023 TaxID=3062626 RepID=UPI0026E42E21|nr:mannitol dehydrogenase family protein [Zobellia sp. 1_MG-2023]MDO6818420.1 mannitol dehydrogenase family protein [Zobellia sp. 1_MG-2023]
MQNPLYLNIENVGAMQNRVLTPVFDRDKIKTSIAHIGVSNFHRAHQAYYMHELIEKHNELNFGICGIDLLDADRKIYNVLKDQDGLYSLVMKDANGSHQIKVIGSIVEYFFGPENPMAVIEKLAHPDIEIISLTIAEDGYNLNEITGEFDQENPVVEEDMRNPFYPKTVFGYLVQAFKLRKFRGLTGCTILSCDNIKGNGDTMKASFFNYVNKMEPELLPWLKENTTFPNSMVDRITPLTRPEDIEILKNDFLIEDQWPVVCEPFSNWVIEDNFFHGRPEWEKVGVQFVEYIEFYDKMKLQLLNAGHTLLGVLGTLHGYKTISEAANDEDFMLFLKTFMDEEVIPVLDKAEVHLVENYKSTLITRFKNPHIYDSLSRICNESSAKVPIFILPTVQAQLSKDKVIDSVAFFVAAWCKYYDGSDDQGKAYKISDSISNVLIRRATQSQQEPLRFLEIDSVFGDLKNSSIFVEKYVRYLNYIRTRTIKECIKDFNANLL